jgi:hypothetical protein
MRLQPFAIPPMPLLKTRLVFQEETAFVGQVCVIFLLVFFCLIFFLMQVLRGSLELRNAGTTRLVNLTAAFSHPEIVVFGPAKADEPTQQVVGKKILQHSEHVASSEGNFFAGVDVVGNVGKKPSRASRDVACGRRASVLSFIFCSFCQKKFLFFCTRYRSPFGYQVSRWATLFCEWCLHIAPRLRTKRCRTGLQRNHPRVSI